MSRPATQSGPRYSLSPAQCRAARALLAWTLDELADRAKVSKNTLNNLETGKTLPQAATIDALRACFEAAGIEFITEPGREGAVRRTGQG